MNERCKVLVVRPEPGLSETMIQVQEQGWEAIACPVMDIRPSPVFSEWPGHSIAITSAHALPALAKQPKDRLLLTVGEKTAQKVRKAGFLRVDAASGDRASLGALCREKGLLGDGLTFACGRGWRGQAYSAEVARDLGARWVEAYRVERIRSLPDEAYRALLDGEVEAVLFFSVENAVLFQENLTPEIRMQLRGVRALCFSDAIMESVCSYAVWRETAARNPLDILGYKKRGV
ncbi:uroporphyrinogen-III synthase [Saccharibacter sp. 17.LH.SD]|uniref:uroporphyrinogen-III synthase n=1 Tax=Saccharibacter sp. 17.LH.SD TaxID=2689393 RepID=UPI001F0073BD|nr:uroporphyrinogen-III synthase [Saccharibacter sp. 17.LH.SD]